MKLSNNVYDILKDVALVWLPAAAVFYATIGKIWGLPYTTEIPATIMAVDTFLGAVLKISTNAYYKEVQDDSAGN
jgi:hypothetical protein